MQQRGSFVAALRRFSLWALAHLLCLATLPSTSFAGAGLNSWSAMGPFNAAGRIRTLAIHPTQPARMWAGSPGGGIWKTTDAGASWAPVNDFLPSMAITSIVLSPANPDVMYAATGDLPPSLYPYYDWREGLRGAGILKSVDGGNTWSALAATSPSSNLDWQYVAKLAIHPGNANILLAATPLGGVYRSTDAGASWSKVRSDGAYEVQFDPTNGNKAVAASGWRAWYSGNAGANWAESSGFTMTGSVGAAAAIAYAPGQAGLLYASVDRSSSCCAPLGMVLRSTDGGATWSWLTSPHQFGAARPFANAIWVDPTNSNHVLIGGEDLYRSTNGGANWTRISNGAQAGSVPASHYAIVGSPGYNGTTNRTIFFGTGGGVFKAADIQAVTATNIGWSALSTGMAAVEFHGGAARAAANWRVAAGGPSGLFLHSGSLPDNGTWTRLMSAESSGPVMTPQPPGDVLLTFAAAPRLKVHRSAPDDALPLANISSGISDATNFPGWANPASPLVLDPNAPGTMLAGGLNLWRTTNATGAGAPAWSVILPGDSTFAFSYYVSAIAVAQGNSNLVWVGDNSGSVRKATDATSASPNWLNQGSGTLPTQRPVRTILIDRTDHNRVYVAFAPSAEQNPSGFQSLWRTTDGGTTWASLGAGLGGRTVRSLAQGEPWFYLYAATDAGVMTSEDGGITWSASNAGLGNVRVNQLFRASGSNVLYAATQGRGVFRSNGIVGPEPPRSLAVARSGAGGLVTSAPAGINCGPDCYEPYPVDTAVTLTAVDSAGGEFTGWSGACSGSARTCTLVVGSNLAVTATFAAAANQPLTVFKSGTGSGPVTSSPAGIICGSTCSASFPLNGNVTLTATANSGSAFAGWSGACSGTAPTCVVNMASARQVTAAFTKLGQQLTIGKAGAGSGPVTSNPAGITCGSGCSAYFNQDAVVTLTATPNGGSAFAGWSGACTGTASTCTVTMSASRHVTATFTPAIRRLAVTKTLINKAGGTLTTSPAGIACGATCSANFAFGSSVTLSATPDVTSTFGGWTGACTGYTPTCVVTMDADRSATAFFFPRQFTLSVAKAGTGSGPVTSNLGGMNCGSECSAAFDIGTKVTLTATPNVGSTFAGWSGACTGSASTCTVTMDAAKTVTATFNYFGPRLSVAKAGTGSGPVTSEPPGIACGSTCAAAYVTGTNVTLTATPNANSVFAGWSGACSGTAPTCTVTMSAAKNVTATFQFAPALTVGKSGAGTVSSNPAGIDCGSTCTHRFASGSQVTLTATPDALNTFTGWSGACTGTGTCTVTMSSPRQVTATFTPGVVAR